jgi:hypothetical protein
MGLHTYTVTINGKAVSIQAKKEDFDAIAEELKRPLVLSHYFRQLYGVIGEKEQSSDLWSPFTQHPLTDEEGYKTALKAYLDSLPDFQILTRETAMPFIQQARDICKKHMPIEDKRETKEQVLQRKVDVVVIEHERELKIQAWRQKWCLPEPVAIPEGMMAAYLQIYFNDSNTMVDYFNAHCPIGESMLLAIVPKQAEKQALARHVLESYPELAKLTWEWHTENYSMGHGNYLESEAFGTEKQHAYDGREEVNVWYEIQFNPYAKDAVLAYKDYPGTQPGAATPVRSGEKVAQRVDSVTIRRNEEHNGIEVVFPAKPEASVIRTLKSLGFRWSPRGELWYTRFSENLMQRVKQALGQQEGDLPLDKP